MEKDLETKIEVCKWKLCAEAQRVTEIKKLGHSKCCQSYEEMGCYNCGGINSDCLIYIQSKNKKQKIQ